MSPKNWLRVEELFHRALEHPPEARRAFLDEACGDDPGLRQQVELLLSNDFRAVSFLEKPAVEDATVTMAMQAGRQLGPYQVLSPLGIGGMGEVHRAHDSKLGRDVAIKTLPAEFARDSARLARFRREARALASLNHPNIGAIYGLEEAGGVECLVLELVEGETLCGPLPIAIALDRADQVAAALEAAHEKGIVHRDLKPANVKVTPEGRVKVLDFGLAKAIQGADPTRDLSGIVGGAHTLVGHIVGTPGYMSPEQARGQEVDQRADIWAFGCLLYELLTGKRVFQGDTVQDTIAAVLEREPDWKVLPTKTPGKVRELLRQCLEKESSRRPGSAPAIRRAILSAQIGSKPRLTAVGMAASFAIVAMGVTIYLKDSDRLTKSGFHGLSSFAQLTDQPGQEVYPSLSPDGKSFLYSSHASGKWDTYLQRVGGRNAINLTKVSAADNTQAVFSPNGEQIAFRSERDGGGIFVMGATGESVKRITDFGYNPSWSPDGTAIVCASATFNSPDVRLSFHSQLFSVNVMTAEKRSLTPNVEFAMQPAWSPNGRRIAYWGVGGAQWDIWTIPSSGGEAVRVTNDAAIDWDPVWSPDGASLYFASDRGGSMNLWRVPIDEETGRVRGEPEAVTTPSPYPGYITVSRAGKTMAYAQRTSTRNVFRVAFDPVREIAVGPEEPVTRGSLVANSPDISPDGETVVFTTQGGKKEDLFVVRTDGTGLRQLTDDAYRNRVPLWSPDGKQIAFYSNRSGKMEVWSINADGSGLRRLTNTKDGYVQYPSWSPDGQRLAYGIQNQTPYIMQLDRPWASQSLQQLPALGVPDAWFALSKWSPDGGKLAGWQVRTDGLFMGITIYSFGTGKYERLIDHGSYPRWLSDSRRLVFTDVGTGKLFLLDARTRKVHEILSVAPNEANFGAVARDDRWIYFGKTTLESDIWMANLN